MTTTTTTTSSSTTTTTTTTTTADVTLCCFHHEQQQQQQQQQQELPHLELTPSRCRRRRCSQRNVHPSNNKQPLPLPSPYPSLSPPPPHRIAAFPPPRHGFSHLFGTFFALCRTVEEVLAKYPHASSVFLCSGTVCAPWKVFPRRSRDFRTLRNADVGPPSAPDAVDGEARHGRPLGRGTVLQGGKNYAVVYGSKHRPLL